MASYFSKTKGCNVWDLENNKLVDMSLMGVGTNILGYITMKLIMSNRNNKR